MTPARRPCSWAVQLHKQAELNSRNSQSAATFRRVVAFVREAQTFAAYFSIPATACSEWSGAL